MIISGALRRGVLVAAFITASLQAAGNTVIIGQPPAAGTGNCDPFGCPALFGLGTYQQVYISSAFTGPLTIGTVTFYNTQVLNNGTHAQGTYTLSFAYTSKAPGMLDLTNPANNITSGSQTFFTGTLPKIASGPSGIRVMSFSGTAFSYDPSNGNLLLTVVVSAPVNASKAVYLDQAGSIAQTTNAYFGTVDGMPVSGGNNVGGLVTGFAAAAGGAPSISAATVDYTVSPPQITIAGSNFGTAQGTVTLDGMSSITLLTWTDAAITGQLSATQAPGTFLLQVTTSSTTVASFDATIGVAGPTGPTGAAGPTGPAGPSGPAGTTGPIGATGPAGLRGPAGPTGSAGAMGVQGPVGPTGPTGPAGPQGSAGAPGLNWMGAWSNTATYSQDAAVSYNGSSYYSLINNNTNNEPDIHPAAWSLLALEGVPGATGPAGPAGPNGPTGDTGPAGLRGSTGATGSAGPMGSQGATGPTGPQGPNGAQGPPGLTWMSTWVSTTAYNKNSAVNYNGASYSSLISNNLNNEPDISPSDWRVLAKPGAVGATGPKGAAGATGAAGASGDTGAQGRTGPTGAKGPTGPMGLTGDTGPAGAQGRAGVTGPRGLIWFGGWSATTSYSQNDAVKYNSSSYISLVSNNQNHEPDISPSAWGLLAHQGATGAPGAPGATGATGATGPTGPRGATGPSGPRGTTGPAGPQGPKGATGAAGPAGPVGPGVSLTFYQDSETVLPLYVDQYTFQCSGSTLLNGSCGSLEAAAQAQYLDVNGSAEMNSSTWLCTVTNNDKVNSHAFAIGIMCSTPIAADRTRAQRVSHVPLKPKQ